MSRSVSGGGHQRRRQSAPPQRAVRRYLRPSAFPEKGWDKLMDLNVKSPFFLTQSLAESLRNAASREKPAKVINVASIDGIRPNPLETYFRLTLPKM